MQYDSFVYNPLKDKSPVSPTGAIDAKSALANNCVPTTIADTDEQYNGIDNPVSILGRPRDVFEAMDMQSAINNFQSPENDNADE